MLFQEYKTKYPLKKFEYTRKDVEAIRKHAFETAKPVKGMTRSQKQNAYMWGVVYKTMSLDTGYLPGEIHQLMGKKFLAYESQGEMFVKSTTTLKTKGMEEYLENVRRFASTELSCFVPLPNETEFSWEVK
jgi:hypothetical protein